MIRVSTPRRFIRSGTKRDRLRMLLIRTPARAQATSILSVTDMPSSCSSALSYALDEGTPQRRLHSADCRRRFDADSKVGLHVGRIDT